MVSFCNIHAFFHFFNVFLADLTFLKTFISTFESFTTKQKLIKKLIERYGHSCRIARKHSIAYCRFRVPDTVPPQKKTLIQMRVCTVLKHWIEPNIDDLGDVLDAISNFIETEMTSKELQVIKLILFE